MNSGVSEITEAARAVAQYRHGRVPRAVRERQILGLAGELFAERGYAAASMDELATRAGVSKPVIYKLFGSKRELFVACTEELGRELTEIVVTAVEGSDGIEELLRAGGEAFFRFIRDNRALWSVAYGTATIAPPEGEPGEGAAPAGVGGKIAELRARQNALVRAVIVAASAELGLELDDFQSEAMARSLNGIFEGLAVWAIERPEIPAEDLAGWVVEMTIPGLDALIERGRG
jgi:AcrR family transcriptional regulator